MKKICVVTGSRAEYGLLRRVMRGIRSASSLKLQLIVTGSHLVKELGYTVEEIISDGFQVDYELEMLLASDSAVGISKSIGLGIIGFADAFSRLSPDLLLVLGDRYEIFAAATAATVARVPIAHMHGGEATEGLTDEAMRHSITKMSHIHFVAAEEYRLRVIQLGEQPENVFLVGGLGIDAIRHTEILGRDELESALRFKLRPRNLLVTFHPVTLDEGAGLEQIDELLAALSQLPDTGLIFTLPNADTGGRSIAQRVSDFCNSHPYAGLYSSLGQSRYFSCLSHVDGVVGNSSSGLIEAPTFHKGTINIGDRQQGRLRASSVIDCKPDRKSIAAAIQRLYSDDFQKELSTVKNPYGEGGACEAIVQKLACLPFDNLLKKRFYDWPIR